MNSLQQIISRRRNRSIDIPHAILFDGADTSVNCQSDADVDDVHDNAFTAEAWIRADGFGQNSTGTIISKGVHGTSGFKFGLDSGVGLDSYIQCATTDARSFTSLSEFTVDGKWHYIIFFFDDAGDRKIYIGIDGIWVASYGGQTAGIGVVQSDAAEVLLIGDESVGNRNFDGAIAWVAISNNDRYNHGTDFVPPSRLSPPSDDVGYLAIWQMNEGSGVLVANNGNQNGVGSGASNRDGTLSNGSWIKI